MKDIVEAIKEKRAAITRLQTELEVLERARALLNGGEMEPRQLSVFDERNKSKRLKIHPRKGKLSPKSSTGQTAAVLREAGVALHIDEIISSLRKKGMEAKKTSLWSTLAKLSKKGVVFYKSRQPSTFGLLEWERAKATAQA